MTASRKSRVPTVSEEELSELYQKRLEIPFEWRNTLYLEWFSEINGRVVIETAGYQLTISPHEWEMDADAEEAQKLANLHAMRDFMAQVIRRRDSEGPEPESAEELDEFAWEERLKESDRLTDAYQEVLEKYMEDVDSEQKEAFVMGWDGLLDALAERDEAEDDEFQDQGAGYDPAVDGFLSIDDEENEDDFNELADDSGGNGEDHPLQAKAQSLAMLAMDVIKRDEGPGTPSYQLVTNLLQVSGKLAGVLFGNDSDYEPETGFVLAVLKRCLNWLNEAVRACQQLMEVTQDPALVSSLEEIRLTAFEIRDSIVELRRELK
ncbi:MAG: hypothetical protein ORN51_05095 [Akkermansiaceae bacterium]|nr:hypothetical protein [Akkermansiaceae bacterium]